MTENLHFEVVGDNSQPTMLLIHGFLSSNLQWVRNRSALSSCFRLVMVEIWGHGQSPAPDDGAAYTVDSYLRQLEGIRDLLGVERWVMVGQSMGAGIVLSYALAYPEHVDRVIITNSRSAIGDFTRQRRKIPEGGIPPLRELPMHPIHGKRLEAGLKARFVAAADRVDTTAVRLGTLQSHTLGCRDKLHEVRIPVLLCHGIYEKAFKDDVEHARKVMPVLQVIELEAGHSTNLEAPEAFNRAVLAFCAPVLNAWKSG